MRRFARVAAGLAAVLVLATGLASAQTLNEIMAGSMDRDAAGQLADPFVPSCDGIVPCNLYQRYYGDAGPDVGVNEPAAPTVDANNGYPRYAQKATRWIGDGMGTNNYPGINLASQACEAWYSIWTGVLDPDLSTYVSYYAGQSTIINIGEDGTQNQEDCAGATLAPIACFGENQTTSVGTDVPNTPVGNIAPLGGLSPVPVPTATASDQTAGTVDVTWPAASNQLKNQRSSALGSLCPATATFNPGALDTAPAPDSVYGVGLFVYNDQGGASRSLASLEGGSVNGGHLSVLANPGTGLACTDNMNCPGVHALTCNAAGVTNGICTGDGTLFSPSAQSITISEAAVNTALGADGPLASGQAAVLVTKVFFAGSVPGSTVKVGTVANASLVSLFSANSPKIGFSGLISSVTWNTPAAQVLGNQVRLGWTTSGPVYSFRLERSMNGIDFQEIAAFDADPSQTDYEFTDRIRGRRTSEITYRLLYQGANGEEQIFTTVDASPGNSRGRR